MSLIRVFGSKSLYINFVAGKFYCIFVSILPYYNLLLLHYFCLSLFYCIFCNTYCFSNNRYFAVPLTEPPSLIFSTQMDIRRITLEGKPWPGNSSMHMLHSNALEVSHSKHTVCYIHHNFTKTAFMCANIDDLNQRWEVPSNSSVLNVDLIQQMALDWVSG